MRSKFVLSRGEVELIVVHFTAALQSPIGFALVGDKSVETHAQKRLKAGLRRVVTGKMVLLERVGEESLGQIFCVLVTCLPLEANVFVNWFPIARENGVESTPPDDLIITARTVDSGVVRDREFVPRTADVSIRIHNPHETLSSDLRHRRAGRLPVDGPVHGSISRTPAVHARWTTDALSHPAHLHSTVGIAAPGNRHLLFLSHAGLAARHAVRRLGADHDRAGAVHDRVLLRTAPARSLRAVLEKRNHHDCSGCFATRGERRARRIAYDWRFTITSVMSSAALVPCANFVNDDSMRSRIPAADASMFRDTTSYKRVAPNSSPVGLTASVTPSE